MRAAPRFVPTLTEVVPAPPWRPTVGVEEVVEPLPPGPVAAPSDGHASDADSAEVPQEGLEAPPASRDAAQEGTSPDSPDVNLLAAAAAAVQPVRHDPTDVPVPLSAPVPPPAPGAAAAPPAPSAALAPPIPAGADPADLAAWVEAEVGESLRRRLHDLIAMALVEQIDTVAARLRGDIEPLIRQAVLDALANEAAAREPD